MIPFPPERYLFRSEKLGRDKVFIPVAWKLFLFRVTTFANVIQAGLTAARNRRKRCTNQSRQDSSPAKINQHIFANALEKERFIIHCSNRGKAVFLTNPIINCTFVGNSISKGIGWEVLC